MTEKTWAPFFKQFRIKWIFLQPFPAFRRTFLHDVMGKSMEGGLKSIGNTIRVRKIPPVHRDQGLQKFPHLILCCQIFQLGPGSDVLVAY